LGASSRMGGEGRSVTRLVNCRMVREGQRKVWQGPHLKVDCSSRFGKNNNLRNAYKWADSETFIKCAVPNKLEQINLQDLILHKVC
jgi:hypothetical protein